MSAISGVSSYGSNPYQQIARAANDGDRDDLAAGPGTAAASSSSSGAVPPSGPPSLLDQLKTSITNAVQQAEQSGSTTDLKSVIQDAVAKVFQDNGINPQSVSQQGPGQAAGQAQGRHHHHHHSEGGEGAGAGSGSASSSSSSTTTSTVDPLTGNSATGTTTAQGVASSSGSNQTVDVLLQLLGNPSGNQGLSGLVIDQKV